MASSGKEVLDKNSRWKLADGTAIPIIGLGTWQAQGADVEKAVFEAIKAGYRHIDTATIYGNEDQVGRAIRRAMNELGIPRSDIFVTTKLWNSDHWNVAQAFETSLRKLGLEYIDLYLMHFPVPGRMGSWKDMERLKKNGYVKSIGVSNFTVAHLNQLLARCTIPPSVNQVELTPLLYQEELIDYCKKNDILIEAYSPLLRGERLDDPGFVAIAKKHGKTVPQILLRWCLQHHLVPLPKSVTPSRISENIALFDFALDAADMKKLDSMNEDLRLCWDPSEAP